MRRSGIIITLVVWLSLLSLAPVAAQSSLTFTLDFEGLPDDQAIGEYVGLTFGDGWRFGDVRSGRYNAPFPADCPDFGGTCSFAINGYGFARVAGASVGQINLPDGVISLSVGVSTSSRVTLAAFDRAGNLIVSAFVESNIVTGRLDRLIVAASASQPIAYVEISGERDTWLIDDLQYTTQSVLRARPARLALAQRVDDVARPGTILTLDLTLENYGRGPMRAATIELPFDDAALTLLDATPGRADVWVSDVQPGLITIRTGPLAATRDLITITIRFRVRDDAPIGHAIGRVARLWYRDGVTELGRGQSNLPRAVIGWGPELNFERRPDLAVNAHTIAYTATGFAPGEPVGIWYNPPTGAPPMTVTTVRADGDGRVSGTLTISDWTAGDYTLVLFSHHSQQTFVGAFSVP